MKKKLTFLVFLFVIAVASGAENASPRRYINLADHPPLPFTDGVLVGDTLYLSGRLGLDSATGKIPENPEQEIRNILDGMKATLGQAGMTMNDLVYVHVFCTDLSLYEQFNTVYKSYFEKEYPARAFLGTGKLLRDAHFEVQSIAVKRK